MDKITVVISGYLFIAHHFWTSRTVSLDIASLDCTVPGSCQFSSRIARGSACRARRQPYAPNPSVVSPGTDPKYAGRERCRTVWACAAYGCTSMCSLKRKRHNLLIKGLLSDEWVSLEKAHRHILVVPNPFVLNKTICFN